MGIKKLNSDIDKGIAGVTAVVLVQYGAAIALGVGSVLYFAIQYKGFNWKKKAVEQDQVAAAEEISK